MHGIIFESLKKFVITNSHETTWEEICQDAKVNSLIMPLGTYPDADLYALCNSTAASMRLDPPQLLHKFGISLMEDLIMMYSKWVNKDWDALEFLLNVECAMHGVAKQLTLVKNQYPTPPQLIVKRLSTDKLVMYYTSHRKLCALAKGLIEGAGKHYKTPLLVTENCCMHQGASRCELEIHRP